VFHAARARRDFSRPRELADGSEGFGGLAESLDGSIGVGVHAWEVLVFAEAGLERPVLGVVGGVVGASDAIEDVLAEAGGVGPGGVTCFEAEEVATHEVVPLDSLDEVSPACAESVGEYDAAQRISTQISPMRIHLATKVGCRDVKLGLVDEADDLDIIRSLRELDAMKSASGDETCAVPGFGTPSNHFTLLRTDFFTRFRGTPEAEVVERVEVRRLAERLLVLSGGITNVVSNLRASDEVSISVDLVGESSGRAEAF